MDKPGPKSAAALAVVVPLSGERLAPPPDLSKGPRERWRAIVDSLPADYFRPGDELLLRAYVVTAQINSDAGAIPALEGAVVRSAGGRVRVHPAQRIHTATASTLGQLAARLRLAPSSRYHPRTAARKADGAGQPRPWE